ncbi:MAG: sulfotransferase [Anaerolineaceae bacterium]|nr:MAG: sulfotransferase [Anaerolineaceae bacterium]
MFFIVSTGRSGTATVAEMLSSVPGYVCLHEPDPALILESSGYRHSDITADEITAVLQQTRHSRLDGRIYCESNQTLSLIIPVLAETFPQARYIWLLRNGLDVVASAMQKQWYSGFSENHNRYEDCTPLEKAWIDGRIRGDRTGDMSGVEWDRLDRFGKCCWYWRYINRLIGCDLNELNVDSYYLLRLETLVQQMPSLLAWMGVETSDGLIAVQQNIAKRRPYHWSRWNLDERQVFESWCGDLMDDYYPEWRNVDGNWQGIAYLSPPIRNQLSYLLAGIRSFIRNYL